MIVQIQPRSSLAPRRYRGTWLLERCRGGVGDALMMSAVARELKRSGYASKVVVITGYPSLFLNNPNVDRISFTGRPTFMRFRKRLHGLLHNVGLLPRYFYAIHSSRLTDVHPIVDMYRKLPVKLEAPGVKVDLVLAKEEHEWARRTLGSGVWVAIHSAGKTSYTPNKEWGADRFQELARRIRKICRVVQVGLERDPPLDVDLSLRGTSLREMAAIIAHCRLAVFQEGGCSHIANAVNTRCIVVAGGFVGRNWAYPDQIFLASDLECAPCFMKEPCPRGRECMRRITVDQVFSHVEKELVGSACHGG